MAKLIYSMIGSLDGYIADERGNFDWAAPDEEVHAFVNDLERGIGTYLYGRRMYDVMRYWETAPTDTKEPPVTRDYAQIWQAADKIVYSRTLATPSTTRTRIEQDFAFEAVRRMKTTASSDMSIGGPDLAAQAIKAGLVDEIICSSCPSWWVEAPRRSRTTSASSCSCLTNAASPAAWFICATAREPDCGATG